MAIASSFPNSYGKLTEGLTDLQEIVHHLRSSGLHEEAADISVLHMRLKRLNTQVPVTADKMDFEKYLAWDIIRTMREVLECPDEKAIVIHCQDIMKELQEKQNG